DFGVVAMANLLLAVVGPLHDSGLSTAFVARRTTVRAAAATLAWATPASGVAVAAVAVVAAPLAARVVAEPAVGPVLRVLGLTFVLRGIAAAPLAILAKELRFGPRAFVATVGSVAEGTCGIALAVGGAGVWALVGGQLAGALTTAVVAWMLVPW